MQVKQQTALATGTRAASNKHETDMATVDAEMLASTVFIRVRRRSAGSAPSARCRICNTAGA